MVERRPFFTPLRFGIPAVLMYFATAVFIFMIVMAIRPLDRELTGRSLDLSEVVSLRREGREGPSATIYRLSESDRALLTADKDGLHGFPKWSPLAAMDGHRLIHWQDLDSAMQTDAQAVVKRVLGDAGGNLDAKAVASIEEVEQLACYLARKRSSLICGWYYNQTNYRLYVLNLDTGLLISLTNLS